MLKVGVCTALNQETLNRLKDCGIKSVIDFLVRDPEILSQESHIAYKDVCSIRRVLLAEHSAYPVSAANLYQNTLASLTILSTGCESLDCFLDGGIYTGEVTEIAGEPAAGKTQLCMWCTAATVKVEGQSVVYIDSGTSFSTECLVDLLTENPDRHAAQEEADAVLQSRLQHIRYVQVHNVFDLFAVLDVLMTDFKEKRLSEGHTVRLVVVDNIASLMYPVMGMNIGHSQGFISQIGLKMKQMAAQFSLAVLVTNSMTSSYNGSVRKPALGKAWSYVPQTRLTIMRCACTSSRDPSSREVCLVKSSRQVTNSMTSSYNGSVRKPALGKAWSYVPQTRLTIMRCACTSSRDPSSREVCLVKSSRQEILSKVVISLNRGANELA